jgi:peroxiredoxin
MPETNTSDTLKVGDRAPDFSLLTANADTTSLSQLIAHGPAVLEFLRGTW